MSGSKDLLEGNSMCSPYIWCCLDQKSITCCHHIVWLIDASKHLASFDQKKYYIICQSVLSWAQLWVVLAQQNAPNGGQFVFGFTPIKSHPEQNVIIVRKTSLFLVCLCWCPAIVSLLNQPYPKPWMEIGIWTCGFDLILCTGQWLWQRFWSNHKLIYCATGLRRLKFNM